MKSFFENNYKLSDKKLWRGSSDEVGARLYEKIRCISIDELVIRNDQPIAFLGFACDEGVKRNQGRIGAVLGPSSLRKVLANQPLHKDRQFYDVGTVSCEDGDLEKAQKVLGEFLALLYAKGYFPIVLGGGHEVAWGHFQGLSMGRKIENLGIINLDAHFDMRPLIKGTQGSSGTPFLQIAHELESKNLPFNYMCIGVQEGGNTRSLFNTAKEHKVKSVLASDFQSIGITKINKKLESFVEGVEKIYLSICLDVFSQAHAPGVSSPQPLGLDPRQILPLLKLLAKSGKLLGIDIAELSPPFDRDEQTARLGASLIAFILYQLKKV
tara:strand:+ start:230 stop:1204 length:975 start_codon:yes stop_codon:yes gene_type:complete